MRIASLIAGLLSCLIASQIFAQPPRGRRPSAEQMASRIKSMDKDNDGKISKSEALGPIERNFARIDSNSDGVLDQGEIAAMIKRFQSGGRPDSNRPSGQPGEVTKQGEDAPNFKLPTLDGEYEVELASYEHKKPVALIFGSYT